MIPQSRATASQSEIQITPIRPPAPDPTASRSHVLNHRAITITVAAVITTIIGFVILACFIDLCRLYRRKRFDSEVSRHYTMTYRPSTSGHDKRKVSVENNEARARELHNAHVRRVETFLEENPDVYIPRHVLPIETVATPNPAGGAKMKRPRFPKFSRVSEVVIKGRVGHDGLVHFQGDEQQTKVEKNMEMNPYPLSKDMIPGVDSHPLPLGSNLFTIESDEEAAVDQVETVAEKPQAVSMMKSMASLPGDRDITDRVSDFGLETLRALEMMDDEAIDAMGREISMAARTETVNGNGNGKGKGKEAKDIWTIIPL